MFTTQEQNPDFSTISSHQHIAKKIILSDAFAYDSDDHGTFLCGMPLETAPQVKGAILAMGQDPDIAEAKNHGDHLNRFLEQVLVVAHNGNGNGDYCAEAIDSPPDQSFEDLYLFANVSKQFRSLRLKQPVLEKLIRRIFNSMEADAAFLRLPQMPRYDLLKMRPPPVTEKVDSYISQE